MSAVASSAPAADMKCQAILLWVTNDPKPPPGKHYEPVDPEIRRRLHGLPLKGTNWFVVNHKNFAVAPGTTREVPMSERCQLNVKNISGSEVEVSHIGQGKQVLKRRQVLPAGHIMPVSSGNSPNSASWLVLLKRVE